MAHSNGCRVHAISLHPEAALKLFVHRTPSLTDLFAWTAWASAFRTGYLYITTQRDSARPREPLQGKTKWLSISVWCLDDYSQCRMNPVMCRPVVACIVIKRYEYLPHKIVDPGWLSKARESRQGKPKWVSISVWCLDDCSQCCMNPESSGTFKSVSKKYQNLITEKEAVYPPPPTGTHIVPPWVFRMCVHVGKNWFSTSDHSILYIHSDTYIHLFYPPAMFLL